MSTRLVSLAIPSGALHSFNGSTAHALRETGYQVAFSLYGGVNRGSALRPFDIKRAGVEGSMSFAGRALHGPPGRDFRRDLVRETLARTSRPCETVRYRCRPSFMIVDPPTAGNPRAKAVTWILAAIDSERWNLIPR